jgi:hypothetical protein
LPFDIAAGQLDRALDDPQRLFAELVGIVVQRLAPRLFAAQLQRPVPQRARQVGIVALPGDLPVQAAVGLEEALVAEWAVEPDVAERVDLGRGDHRRERVVERLVELADDEAGECPVQRDAADQQQDRDPAGRDQHHPARQAAGVRQRHGRSGVLRRRDLGR